MLISSNLKRIQIPLDVVIISTIENRARFKTECLKWQIIAEIIFFNKQIKLSF